MQTLVCHETLEIRGNEAQNRWVGKTVNPVKKRDFQLDLLEPPLVALSREKDSSYSNLIQSKLNHMNTVGEHSFFLQLLITASSLMRTLDRNKGAVE